MLIKDAFNKTLVFAAAFSCAGFAPLTKDALPKSPITQIKVIGKDQRVPVPKRYKKTAKSIGILIKRSASPAAKSYMCTAFASQIP